MPKMIMSIDGVVIKEVQLAKDRTTLGRRPYNDVVIDNLAVSGEHAVLEMEAGAVWLEDLGSTNGTYVNGKAIKRQALQHGDTVEIGKYRIKYLAEPGPVRFDKTMVVTPRAAAQVAAPTQAPNPQVAPAAPAFEPGAASVPTVAAAAIQVLSGAATGRELPLLKAVTTIGKPGVAVAAITRRPQGFAIKHVEGGSQPLLNGAPVGTEPVALNDGDLLELAGTRMRFVQAA